MSGGRGKRALLADAVEALIAALYLDGGIEAARGFVERHILAGLPSLDVESAEITDHKSALQEMARSLKLPQPRYSILEERGPEHAKTFTIEVRLGQDWFGRAEGCSKKSASQEAARRVLNQLMQWAEAQPPASGEARIAD
jgi:ribonuclease-3